MCWPTSTGPAPATAQPRPSTAGSNTSAAPPSGSATSPTTSPAACSKPADSDPDYTLDSEEPEIVRRREGPAGQERGLEIVVGPFDDALVFRLPWPQHHHLRRQRPPERLTLPGQLDPPGPPAADRALTIPDQHPRHRPE